MDALSLPGTPEVIKGREENFACGLRVGGMVLNKMSLADQPVHALTRWTLCASPGGDAIAETSPSLLDALNREQGRLGNLQPGEQFSLAAGGKSIKAIFAMAGDQNVCYHHTLMHTHRAVCVQGFPYATKYIRQIRSPQTGLMPTCLRRGGRR